MVKYFLISLFAILMLASCSEFQKVLKSADYEKKYEKALEYYNEKDYFRSQSLLEELMSIYKGTAKGEEVYYYYAYCYYGQGDYILAGYHFRNFVATYPNSKHAEECSFLTADCFFKNSPEPSLDQDFTKKAIDEFQMFIDKYPLSDKVKESNEAIDKLRLKLETKSFNNAKLYYDLGEYKAAVIALKGSLNDYPDTEYREELLFLILKSNYLLANNSIASKKAERYKNTVDEYYAFTDEFPNSKYLKDAEKILENAKKELKQL